MHNNMKNYDFIKKGNWVTYCLISLIISFASTPIHEAGHVIANWLSGIQAGMSYAREYTLDGRVETVIGTLGGPLFTVLLAYAAIFFIFRRKRQMIVYPFAVIMCMDRIYTYFYVFIRDIKGFIGCMGLPGFDERIASGILNINPYTFFIVFQGLEATGIILIILSLGHEFKKNLFVMLVPVMAKAPMKYIGFYVIEKNLFPEQYKIQFGSSIESFWPFLLCSALLSAIISLILLIRQGKIMRRPWFELIGILGFIVLVSGFLIIINQINISESQKTNIELNFREPTGYSAEIEPYVNFLEAAPHIDPVDYVISLFDEHDIVVLSERDHRDITQYELIYSIISDKRFIEMSGTVFTEVGTQTIDNRLNIFLSTGGLTEKEVDKKLIELYRDLPWMGYWGKNNFYDLLKEVYYLNNSLSNDKKVSINCSDMPIDWNEMTPSKYKQEIKDRQVFRDKIMADYIAEKYMEIQDGVLLRKKILVIMNYRHAFKKHLELSNTTAYLNEEFPGKVASVMINALKPLPGSNDHNDVRGTVQDGKWDAAFRYTGNKNTAFDFTNTPFGEDHFDYYDFIYHEYTYQDIFNGFIFYYPLEKHLVSYGIPGFIDREFLPVFKQRWKIALGDVRYSSGYGNLTYGLYKSQFNMKHEMRYTDLLTYNKEIEAWLK